MVVIGSVLAVGTVHVPTLLVVGALAIACGGLALHAYQRDVGHWPVTLPAIGVGALTAWTALQALPLPARVVAAIAPQNANVWAYALAPLGQAGPAWHPISLDPGATWVEVLKGMTYLGVVFASSVIAYRRGAVFGVALVALSGLSAALFTIVHGLTGMTKVFGIYEPIYHFAPWHIGPLLNANHLAGYLNLAAMCGMGVLLMGRTRIPRWVAGLGVATIVGVTVASASRGGVVVLPVGVAIVVLLLRTRSGRSREDAVSGRWLNILTLSAIGGGVVLAWLGLTTKQWDELLSEDLSKLSILEWARPLLSDHLFVGIGRGAFETVYPAYRPNVGHMLWTHPENVLAQWAAEWGAPVAVLAALFFLWLLRPARMGATRSAVAAGGMAGVGILVLQNWVDFSLELPGVAIAVVTVIGSCWGDTSRRGVERWDRDAQPHADASPQRDGRHWGRRQGPLVAFAVAGAGALALAGLKGMPTPLQDRMHFQELVDGPPVPAKVFEPMIRAAMLRHPAEPYLPLAGAARAWRVRDADPIPYLERVLTRAKRYGRAHLLLSNILFARRANLQALLELKLAVQDEPALVNAAVASAVKHTQRYDDLLRIVPDGVEGAPVLDTLAAWMSGRDPAVGEKLDQKALALEPGRVGPLQRRALALVAELGKGDQSERCGTEAARKACAEAIEKYAIALEQASPETSHAARLRARVLLALDQPERAEQALSAVCDRATDRMPCVKMQLEIAAKRKDQGRVEKLLEQVAALGCAGGTACSTTYVWIGNFSMAQGNRGGAANAYQRATRHDPQNADAWLRLGDASARLGSHARAVQAYERVMQLAPSDAVKAKLEVERRKMVGSLVRE